MIQKSNEELYEYVYVKAAEIGLDIMSPRKNHGGHIAIKFNKAFKSKLTSIMEDNNIIVDYRDFNETEFVMRAGLIAMYNDKEDCDAFVSAFIQFAKTV